MPATRFLLPALLLIQAAVPTRSPAADVAPRQASFNRDIRPVLSDVCFSCHGPAVARRRSPLRLDTEAGAFADLGGRRAIVPGDAARSELYRRIASADADERMPPPDSGRRLSPEQIEAVRLWIDQGARWEAHWSFQAPRRPALPAPRSAGWALNPIDLFVLDRLEREGLRPSPQADRPALLRRASLDLTGLPPSPAELDELLADPSPSAYEKAVDRLLESPRYGERMASRWLDAARYADTSGYQSDGERFMWRWRDWVIEAYNRGMPFDRFTVEQLAGDLLPGATVDQKIATGFNRNHRGNGEGGIIPEEYAVEYVVDRVDTVATVWLGLTVGCARCHDHKYDPITQKEYYRLYAYFNSIPEHGRALKYGNSPPVVASPTDLQRRDLEDLDRRLSCARADFAACSEPIQAAQRTWERGAAADVPPGWTPAGSLEAAVSLGQAARFDGRRSIDCGDIGAFGFLDRFTLAAWIQPEGEKGGAILSRMADADEGRGYGFCLKNGRLQLNLVQRWLDDALRVETESPLPAGRRLHIAATYDGSRTAEGIRIYVDGAPQKLRVLLDALNQTFRTDEPFRVGGGGGPENRFAGQIEAAWIYRAALHPEDVEMLAVPGSVAEISGVPESSRSAPQARKLRACFLEDAAAPREAREARDRVLDLERRRQTLQDAIPTTMVMEELPSPRPARVLLRGAYDRPGDMVSRGVPAALPRLPGGAPDDRLGLAFWLVDPANPLTARVAVNRIWQMFFGTGLVETVDDFGSQGDWPSHPELLDWLAVELRESGWDIKRLQRLVATSAAYRQSSRTTDELQRADPANRLLARGPRLRLPAEMIRDQALLAGGLLVERLDGPSVKPFQPPGLWKDLTGADDYKPDSGESLHRRSLYTFWKRTVAPPAMAVFDAATRETCIVRETRTNTPLQALTLMNEDSFVEAARGLGARLVREGGKLPAERLRYGFRVVTGRWPEAGELAILVRGFERHAADYRSLPGRAAELAGSSSGSSAPAPAEQAGLAAYTLSAGLLLNLDEAVTKE